MKRVRAQQEAQDKADAATQASKAATVSMLIPDAKVDWTKFRYFGVWYQSIINIYVSVCLSLSVCLCVVMRLPACQHACMCVCLFCLSVCLSVCLSPCLFV